jgi:tetratricopeptide (TPR) repeat protein
MKVLTLLTISAAIIVYLVEFSCSYIFPAGFNLLARSFLPLSLPPVAAASENMNGQKLNDRLQQVLAFHKNGQMDDAIAGYVDVIPLVPLQIQLSLYGNLGALYISRGQYEEARDTFTAAVNADSKHASSQFNLAVLLTSKFNEHGKALKHCAFAMRADPSSHKAFHLMGNIMQNLGKHEEAEKYFEQAELLVAGQEETATDNTEATPTSRSLASLLGYNVNVGDIIERIIDGEIYNLECISHNPLIFTVDDLLSASECEHIQQRAAGTLEKSFIMGNEVKQDGKLIYNNKEDGIQEDIVDLKGMEEDPSLYRSSFSTWLPRDNQLETFQVKLSQLLHIPLSYIQHKSEELQVVKYHVGGQFKVHQDSSLFHPRLVTALAYLNTVDGQDGMLGGETWFPYVGSVENVELDSVEDAIVRALDIYDCSTGTGTGGERRLPGLTIQPKLGRVVIFFNYNLTSSKIDPHAVHAGLPVCRVNSIHGRSASSNEAAGKWIANYWVGHDPILLSQLLLERNDWKKVN